MTNKEAIEVIKSMGLIIDATSSPTRREEIYEALNLAIKALEEVDGLRADADYYTRELEEEWGIINDEDWEEEE